MGEWVSYPKFVSPATKTLHPDTHGVKLTLDELILALLKLGTNPAASGLIRMANNELIKARNAGNNADITLLGTDSSDHLLLGSGLTGVLKASSSVVSASGIVNADVSGSAAIAASKLAAGVMGGSGLMTFPAGVLPGPTTANGGLYYWSALTPGTGEHNTGISGRGLALVYARISTNLYAALVGLDNSNFGSGNGVVLAQWGGSLFGYGDSGSVVRVYWNTQFGTVRIKNSSGSTVAEVSALLWMV
jgi:hypothetical protein